MSRAQKCLYRPTTYFVIIGVAREGHTASVAPPLNNSNFFTFKIYFFILFTYFGAGAQFPRHKVGALQAEGKVTDYATIIMAHRVPTVPSFKWFLHFLFNILFKLLNSLPSTPNIDQDHRAFKRAVKK